MVSTRTLLFTLSTSMLALTLATPAMAQERSKKKKKAARVVRDWTQGHLRLGDAYLLTEQPTKALAHFKAILQRADQLEALVDRSSPKAAKEGKRAKRGKKRSKKIYKALFRSYLGASIAAHQKNNVKEARAYAQQGLDLADDLNNEREARAFERFLSDPQAFVDRFAPDPKNFEKRLQDLATQLPK